MASLSSSTITSNSPSVYPHLNSNTSSQSVILVTAGYDHSIRFWDPLYGSTTHSIPYPDSQVNALKVTPDKAFVVAAGNPKIRFYDIPSGHPNPVLNFEGHKTNVTNVQLFSNMNSFVSSSEDKSVKVWDLRSSLPTRDFLHRSSVTDVQLHPTKNEMTSCDVDGNIKIWDLTMNQCLQQLIPEQESAMQSLSISTEGETLAAGTRKGHCYIWKWTESHLQPLKQLLAHKKYLIKCRWSPNNKYLVTCSADSTIKVWHAHLHTLVWTLSGHQRWVWDIAFSSDTAYLVSASSDHTAKLWDMKTGTWIREYKGHQKAVVAVGLHDQMVMPGGINVTSVTG